MNFEQLLFESIKPVLLVLIPILWYIGSKIKDTARIADAWIPFILMTLSIAFSASYVLLFEGVTPSNIWLGVVQGFAIAATQGWLFQAKKQAEEIRG